MTSGSVHKHKAKKEKKKKTKKSKNSNKSSHVEDTVRNYDGSGDEITDLNEELHPIGHYINDREEMIRQMFSVIKPDKLRAMLPPILKDSSVDELKVYCLDELLGMSLKRVSSVLVGRELDSSSESDDIVSVPGNAQKSESSFPHEADKHRSSDEEKTVEPEAVSEEANGIDDRSCPANDTDMLEIGITSEEMGELLNDMPPNTNNERKRQAEDQEKPGTSGIKKRRWKLKRSKDSDNVKEAKNKDVEDNKINSNGKTSDNDRSESVNIDESKGKTLLEILELEMRARAIRALLKQQGGTLEGDDASNVNEPSDPQTILSEAAKQISSSNSVSESQCKKVCVPGVGSEGASGITTKLARKKLNRNAVKPVLGSIQCVKNTDSVSNALEISLSDSFPTSESRNDNGIKDIEEKTGTGCLLTMSIKSEVSNDEETRPDLESSDRNDKYKEIDSKTIESPEIYSLRDREDGELSSDAEKSSPNSVLEIQAEGGSSDVIVLHASEDDLLDSSAPENQGTSNNTKDNNQTKINETKEIVEINLIASESSNQGASSNRYENKKKSSGGGKVLVNGILKSSANNDIICSKSVKKSVKQTVDYNIVKYTNPQVVNDTMDDSAEILIKSNAVDVSWAARWLQSKGVQKVVYTSKMCAKIRNRMKSAHKERKITAETLQQEEIEKQSMVIVGSVNEYNMLDKPKLSQQERCAESDEKNTDSIKDSS